MKAINVIYLFLVLANISIAQEFPTNGEIYDYEVGDIFHYRNIHAYGEYSPECFDSIFKNTEVVDKYYSVNYDTVCYQYFTKRLGIYDCDPDTTYAEYYTTSCISQLDSLRDGDTVIEDPDVYNGRKIVEYAYYYVEGPDETSYSYQWVVGCGRAFYYSSNWCWATYMVNRITDELVYFHKGEEEWGEEQIILGIAEKEFNTKINIYPNPIRHYLNISFDDGFNSGRFIKIYNSAGQLVKFISLSLYENRIDVSYLPDGLYFITFIDEKEQILFKEKFLKAH